MAPTPRRSPAACRKRSGVPGPAVSSPRSARRSTGPDMSILYGVGQYFNVLGRVAAGNLSSFPSASTTYPLTNLCDFEPVTLGAFGSAVANSQLTVDGNIL